MQTVSDSEYLAAIDHALAHTFVVTKNIPFDEKDEGNDFFPHIPAGTILEVEAVICHDFGLDVRVSWLDNDSVEFSIGYLATHCELHGQKQIFISLPDSANSSLN